jgi:sigma-B regulation protein RsbU (phosphoserine phosphatase)
MPAITRRPTVSRPRATPPRHSSCEFIATLMKLQRASQLITSTLDLDDLLERVVTDIAASIGCVEVSVWLRDPDSEDMVLHGVRGCTQNKKGMRLKIGEQGMVGHVAASGEMRYAPDVSLDPYYMACEFGTRSEVNVPLLVAGKVIGVLSVDHLELDAFSPDQLQVFHALAGHIAVAIQNANLFRRERVIREQMETEANDARAIQQSLFLKATPLVPGFCFETAWHPAGAVAGDWFDFIDLGNERYGIVLADVSGKGMPAALLMTATRAILRSVVRLDPAPSRTLSNLNQTLIEDFPSGQFVTMIYAVLDARTRQLTLASAGHLRPLLINGDCSFIDVETGLPLGLASSTYPEYAMHLNPGSGLLLYTDGITEAMNHGDEEFGPARLFDHFLQPDACVDGLIAEVQRFGHGSRHTDDATAVLIRSR